MQEPSRRSMLSALLKPLLADPATVEVGLFGDRPPEPTDSRVRQAPPADTLEGDVVVALERDVLAPRGLASAHAGRHLAGEQLLVLGYTPLRVLHERAPGDFAARVRAEHYEARCRLYDQDPSRILPELWGGNLSVRRVDWPGMAPTHELGLRCAAAGLRARFDRSLRALRVYEPSLSEFVRDARVEGGSSGGSAAASLALRALVLAAGTSHVWWLQDRAARALWEFERG